MNTKYFEVRDRATFIPVKACRLHAHTEQERYLIAMGGYGTMVSDQTNYIMITRLDGGNEETSSSPHEWQNRTMKTAHEFILKNYDYLGSGEVIDVEYILKETEKPKKTQNKSEGIE